MKTKSRLKYQPELNFHLIGITSSESIARLSWMLNKALRLKFALAGDLEVFHEKLETPQIFSLYQHTNLHGFVVYRLIANKSDQGYLSAPNKCYDYFLQCLKESGDSVSEILSVLRKTDDIQMAVLIEKPDTSLIQKLVV